MSAPAFLMVFFLASGGLALWVDVRLADRGPSSLRSVFITIATGMLCLQVAKGVAAATLSAEDPTVTIAVLFGIVMPALVYTFLTTIWLLKVLRGAMLR